jgi:hypothetical protein
MTTLAAPRQRFDNTYSLVPGGDPRRSAVAIEPAVGERRMSAR